MTSSIVRTAYVRAELRWPLSLDAMRCRDYLIRNVYSLTVLQMQVQLACEIRT
jgi:hypothetical protein